MRIRSIKTAKLEGYIGFSANLAGLGYIGFSANLAATQRWVLNASRKGSYRKLLREHLAINVHKKLAPSRIKTDIEAVDRVINLCENVFKNPWDESELISLSTGLEAIADIKDSLFKAKEVGLKGSQEFIDTRGSANPELDFFDPLPKSKMKTFKDLKKVVKVNVKDRLIPLRMIVTYFRGWLLWDNLERLT